MLKKTALLILMILLFMSVTATAENNEKAETSIKYIVTPALVFDTEIETVDKDVSIRTVYDTIRQGETNLHEKTVSSSLPLLVVDLNWGDSTDSLRLKVHTPGGSELGPYYDSADGTIDGRINLFIKNSNGIETGTWMYEVYGYRVSGTEGYTI